MTTPPLILKVAGDSIPKNVAGAICGIVRDGHRVQITAIGAAAVNQAVKAAAIASRVLETEGVYLSCVPRFTQMDVNGVPKTGIMFDVSVLPNPGIGARKRPA